MLCINSTPAERARGCVFAERFVDPIAVAKNRGTVVGTVPIRYLKGAYYNGSDGNTLTYPISSVVNKSITNFVIDCTPIVHKGYALNATEAAQLVAETRPWG